MSTRISYQDLAASGSVIADGVPVVIYSISVANSGGVQIELMDYLTNEFPVAVYSSAVTEQLNFPFGIMFPNGCVANQANDVQSVGYKKA